MDGRANLQYNDYFQVASQFLCILNTFPVKGIFNGVQHMTVQPQPGTVGFLLILLFLPDKLHPLLKRTNSNRSSDEI